MDTTAELIAQKEVRQIEGETAFRELIVKLEGANRIMDVWNRNPSNKLEEQERLEEKKKVDAPQEEDLIDS